MVHARFLVVCLGRMAFPVYPDIKGAESFAGPTVHTARWWEDVELKVGLDCWNESVVWVCGIVGSKWTLTFDVLYTQGKRVAVIGTGASAIQVSNDDDDTSHSSAT